ncbi:unnamed protein product [Rotaria sordida]|uniref:Uncharacterized protein n=1 Tax=Rotaria sordida TaxID=392033 RepID=A0A814GS30_9BILA|nr:unnamed protein product [Rotaria sordida]CAF3583137.1 unnamed protein product [Rotaria sordida]
MEETNRKMKHRDIIVKNWLDKYKKGMENFDHSCDSLIKIIEKLELNDDNNNLPNISDTHREHIEQLYCMHNLDKLSSEQSVKAIDDILEDIAFRKKCLLSRLGTATSLLESKPEQIKLFNNTINKSIRMLEIISIVEKELNYLRENLQAIEQYTDEYDKLLRDDQFQDMPYSKYILLLEMLRVRTEELEIFNYFPQITQLMEKWQSNHDVDNEFKPKVLDLFKSVELDVKHLLSDDNCIYLLPYKIGVIGDRNVGKNFRVARICKLAICASRTIINTCFRRGYVVSQTRYRWLAAGASIIPFLDELPAFFGREKIRQTFGIHDNSTITNAFYRIKDSFEEYLIEKKLTVPKKYLKSGYFKYLISKKTKQIATTSSSDSIQYVKQEPTYQIQNKTSLIAGHAGTIIGRTGVILGTLGKVADDAARLIIPSSSIALRAVSITGIVVGAVLTPVFAGWTFYYTGKRMNKHLHLLCDDLVIILAYFIIAICNSCHEDRQLRVLTFSNEDSSFSNADSSSSGADSLYSDEE